MDNNTEYCFSPIIANLPNGILISDFDGKIIYSNESFSKIFGYNKEDFATIKDILSIVCSKNVNGEAIKEFQIFLGKVFTKKEKLSTISTRLKCKDGSMRDTDLHLCMTEEYIILSIIDITKEKNLFKKVAENEAKFRILFENSNDIIFLLEDRKITYFNNRAKDIFNCDEQYLFGKTIVELSPKTQPNGTSSKELADNIFRKTNNGNSNVFEWQLNTSQKKVFHSEISLNAFEMIGRNIMLAIIRDITERKNALEKLEESRKNYMEIVEHANSAIIKIDIDGNITFFNEYAEKIFKYSRHKIIGQNIVGTLIVPNEQNGFLKDISKEKIRYIIKNIEYFFYWESWNIDADGENIYMSWTNKPLKNKRGILEGIVSIGTDVTETKKIYDKLRENEQKYRTLFNSVNDSILLIDLKGNLIEANEQVETKLGLNISGMRGKPFYKIFPNNQDEYFFEAIDKVVKEGYGVFEFEIQNIEGKLFPAEVRAQLIKYEGKDVIITINRDISERKKEQRKIFNAIIDTEEEERSRVARELHDGVSPILSTAKLYAQSLRSCDENMKETVFTKIEETIDEAIKSVSEISNNLSPHILQNFGLITAVNSFSEKVAETNNIEVVVKSNFDQRLPEKIEITLFRVSVELINNALKHSKANLVELNFLQNNLLILQYKDNGIGFNFKSRVESSKRMGLFNILNRIKSLNGNVFHDSKDKKGTKLTISIPIKDEQEN